MNPRRPAPLEPDATDAERLVWYIHELNYWTFQAHAAWRWAWLSVALNLAAVAFTVWNLLT
jgi:hypothetical protein